MSFVRPIGQLSSSFTASEVSNQFEELEKANYSDWKKKIQAIVFKQIGLMKWEFDLNGMSHSVMSKLKDKITKAGLTFTYIEGEYFQSDHNEWSSIPAKFEISLPEKPLKEEEDGYFSDGWEKEFRASFFQKVIQKALEKEYELYAKNLEKIILSYPGYKLYILNDPNGVSKIVMDWIKQDLKDRGFELEKKSTTIQNDISGVHAEYSGSLHITNPKINNYKTLLIRDLKILWVSDI